MITRGPRGSSLHVASPYSGRGGSTRVRIHDWLDHLGIAAQSEFDYARQADNLPGTLSRVPHLVAQAQRRLRSARPRSGTLLLSRELSPFGWGRAEARWLTGVDRGVYDMDDSLLDDHGSGVTAVFDRPRRCAASLQAADQVIVGNDYLADRASDYTNRIAVIPSCVEPQRYPDKTDYEVGDRPRLVWVGSPATEPYLRTVTPALLDVHRRTGARLRVVSRGAASLGDLEPMIDRSVWEPALAARALQEADVAIAPLPDLPYARGKCAYKILEYAAAGIPVVASPVGANALALERIGGLAATSDSEWVDALGVLLDESVQHRARRGQRGRDAVAAHYSFAAWEQRWIESIWG